MRSRRTLAPADSRLSWARRLALGEKSFRILAAALDEGHAGPGTPPEESVGRLDPEVAPSEDHHAPRAAIEKPQDALEIGKPPESEDVLRLRKSLDRRHDRSRAGRDHQPVVGDLLTRSIDHLSHGIDTEDLDSGPDFDVVRVPEEPGFLPVQLRQGIDLASEDMGEPAHGIAHLRRPLEEKNLGSLVGLAGPGRGRGSAESAADDDDLRNRHGGSPAPNRAKGADIDGRFDFSVSNGRAAVETRSRRINQTLDRKRIPRRQPRLPSKARLRRGSGRIELRGRPTAPTE